MLSVCQWYDMTLYRDPYQDGQSKLVKSEELKNLELPDEDDDVGGWAGYHEEVDYSKKVVFEDSSEDEERESHQEHHSRQPKRSERESTRDIRMVCYSLLYCILSCYIAAGSPTHYYNGAATPPCRAIKQTLTWGTW